MRLNLFAAVSAVALIASAASAQDAAPAPTETPAPAPAPAPSADAVTDAELQSFNTAMTGVRTAMEGVQGGQPTPEQQAAMAAAIESSGLSIDRFNALSSAVSADATLQARLAVIATPESPAGSVAAGVTDAEVAQFAPAYAQVAEIAQAAGGAPSAEQQAQMAAAIEGSGLTIERFNEISGALSSDQRLQARVALAQSQG